MDKVCKIQVGEKLNTRQLYQRIGISSTTWKNNKERILYDLSNCYQYQVIYKGKSVIYHFIKKYCDYHYKQKRKKNKNTIYRDIYFEENIVLVLLSFPINTAKNVSRMLVEDYNENILKQLNYTDGTMYQYTRIRMRDWFGKSICDRGSFNSQQEINKMKTRRGYIKRKVWCVLGNTYQTHNTYIPLSEKQLKELHSLFTKFRRDKSNIEIEIQINADYDAGRITKEERDQLLGCINSNYYYKAKKAFKQKYGSYPVLAAEYEVYQEYQDEKYFIELQNRKIDAK